jgi:hypothetical protein
MEGSGHGLMEGTRRYFTGRTEENYEETSARISGLQAKI